MFTKEWFHGHMFPDREDPRDEPDEDHRVDIFRLIVGAFQHMILALIPHVFMCTGNVTCEFFF